MYFNLGLVGKNWSIFHVSPLWNLHFNTGHLNESCKKLKKSLEMHFKTNSNKSFEHISVKIEPKEAHHENIALKVCTLSINFIFKIIFYFFRLR